MRINKLHAWPRDYKKAVQIQEYLRDLLILKKPQEKLNTVAGADVSYDKQTDRIYAGVIVLTLNRELRKIEEVTFCGKTAFPYIPGLLSFREAPALLKCFKKLHTDPDVILFDGQGIAHPRLMGLASHMGLFLEKPTIGCAKKRLIGEYEAVDNLVGAYSRLVFHEKIVGVALRTKLNTKPVFVSPGHKINLALAMSITMKTCRGYRMPEPTRQAHLLVNKIRKKSME